MSQTADHHETTASQSNAHGGGHGGSERAQYLRFGAMIATSTVVMFALTYTNSFAFDHVRWSEERVYMALLMGGAMAVVMPRSCGACTATSG